MDGRVGGVGGEEKIGVGGKKIGGSPRRDPPILRRKTYVKDADSIILRVWPSPKRLNRSRSY